MSTAFRFLHSADLHLGRRFGNLPEDVRFRLVEARHQILHRLAEVARAQGARDVLLAGDTFDSETPTDPVWRQALATMAAAEGLRWWLLPGNHDSLAAETLWARFAAQAPDNIRVLGTAAPLDLAPGVVLLPAPLPRRRPGHDLTAWMAEAATPEGALRLGLAHGPVQDFSEEGSGGDGIIAPDRARTAGLDYLALGDWHGQMLLGDRTAYAGTPEADGFRHTGRGACLAVRVEPGRAPEITRIDTGRFHWAEAPLPLVPGQDPVHALTALVPAAAAARRDHLLRVRATGRATLADHLALQETAQGLAPDFAHFALDVMALDTEIDAADLEALDRGGALRLAAEGLAARAQDTALADTDRRIAAGALNRLYAYLREGA
ncbi:MAG: metallophosphoesterase [Pararhodobacter sp.]|nr:metallophosphoesterase [Pararhodobacter sp.]